MGSGKTLTEVETAKINTMKGLGWSNRKIAREIHRSEGVIRNYFKKGVKYGQRKPSRGNKKLTAQQKGQIKQEATKNRLNSRQIKEKLLLPVTHQHVSRILRSDQNIKWGKIKGKPHLTSRHKQNRLEWARKHMHYTTEWDRVIFSDEKKFNLDGPDGYSCYWHDLRNKNIARSKRNFGGGSVMVWGAFTLKDKLPICFISFKMTSADYSMLLEDVLINYLENNSECDFIFQQDNASIHVSKASQQWFKDRNIEVMEWPACSPDCNPIENLWAILAQKVYANGRQYSNVTELKQAIKGFWGEITPETIKNLILSMPKRVFEVIRSQGGHTKY